MPSITLYDFADELDLSIITVRSYIRRFGIKTHRLRVKEKGNQACAAITSVEADLIRQWREDNGFTGQPFYPLSATA